MVGVAGRSKGCVTCRQRRVKCDETHPECERCKKAKRVCGGYVQNNFIDGLPSGVRKAANAQQRQLQQVSQGRTRELPLHTAKARQLLLQEVVYLTPPPSDNEVSDASLDDDASSDQAADSQGHAPKATLQACERHGPLTPMSIDQRPYRSLNMTSFRDHVYLNFACANILKGLFFLSSPSVKDLSSPGGVLNLDCLLSISTTYFGMQHHDQGIVNHGMQRYGRALSDLNNALMHPEHSRASQVLEAVTVMMLYEILSPTSMKGWIDHILGLERLMDHRGPEAHMSGADHQQFLDNRSSILFACLAMESPSLMATPEWITIPWSLDPDSKSQFHRLLDILMDVPELLSHPKAYYQEPQPSLELYRKLFAINKELKAKLTQLEEWWDIWDAENADSYYLVPVDYSALDPYFTPTRWTERYEFSRLMLGHHFAVYHAAKVLLLDTSRYIDSLDPNVQKAHLNSMSRTAYKASIEICRSIDYHVEAKHRGGGSLLLLFPARLAWKTIGDTTPDGRWLRYMISNSTRGVAMQWKGASTLIFGEFPTEPHIVEEISENTTHDNATLFWT